MGQGSSLGRVRGLGPNHEGGHHWLLHRFSAIVNLVLMSWFVVSLLMLPEYSYETVSGWLAQPLSAVAMILLLANVFWHARMGLTVLIEDYIHNSGSKYGLLAVLNMAAIGGAAFGIFSVASLALGVQG